MNKNYLFGFAFLFILVSMGMTSATLNVSLSDQGTEVTNTTSGALLSTGDLIVTIYDALTGGNLIYTETFTGAIGNGTWNVMLGEIVNLPLEFGRIYYKDYSIAGEDASFVNGTGQTVGRQFFYSPLGDINSSKVFGAFTGASNTTNGTTGIVLAPQAGEQDKCLRGDGTWGSCATSGNLEYMFANLAADTSVATNAVVPFVDNVSSGISVSSGAFTLTAGKTYLLRAQIRMEPAGTGFQTFRWYDQTNSEFIGAEMQLESEQQATNNNQAPIATVIITPSSNINVALNKTAGTETDVDQFATWATIVEIGVGADSNGGGAFYGSLKWNTTTNCFFNYSSTNITEATADVDCDDNARTAEGLTTSVTTAGNAEGQLPQIKFASMPSGYYKVIANGFLVSSGARCVFRIGHEESGINSSTYAIFATNTQGHASISSDFFLPTDQGSSTINVYGSIKSGTTCRYELESDEHEFKISVYYFPSFGTAKSDTIFSDLDGDTRINTDGDGSDSDNMTFFTAGIERMRIDSLGNVNVTGIFHANSSDYFLSETDTGAKWIDGKTIYRRVYVVPNIASAGDSVNITLDSTVDTAISVGGYVRALTSNDKIFIGAGVGDSVTAADSVSARIIASGTKLQLDANAGLDWEDGHVWIEYTK